MTAAVSFISLPSSGAARPFATTYLPDKGLGIDLAAHDYVEEEYLVPGAANIYEYTVWEWELQVRNKDVPFVTRLLVRRPADTSRFSGVLLLEPLHPSQENPLGWINTHPYLLRSGHAWAGLTVTPANVRLMRDDYDPARYGALQFTDSGLGWEAMAAVGTALKSGAGASPLAGFPVRRVYMSGGSFTGSWQRTFLGDGFHDRARMADGSHVFDGFLIMISAGAFARTGYLPIHDGAFNLPVHDPRRVMQPRGVPVIEMLSEMEAETNLGSRRPDSDDPADRYRLVEIAGASHSSGKPSPIRQIVPAQLLAKGLPPLREEPPPGEIEPVNEFPYGYFATAALDNIHRWVTEGTPPPRTERLQLHPRRENGPVGISPDALPIMRDEHGNALGGLRSPYVDVPFASYYPHSKPNPYQAEQMSDLRGNQTNFPPEKLRDLYGTPEAYAARVETQVDAMVKQRWLLADEGEIVKAQARALRF